MRKILFTLLAFFIVFIANAQKITEKDLLGRWTITAMTVSGNHMDFKNCTITVSDDWQKDSPQMTKGEWEAQLKKGLEYFGTANTSFSEGSIMSFYMEKMEYGGGYHIVEENGSTYIQDDVTPGDKFRIELKNGLLYWELAIDKGNIFHLTFEKAVK
ncbi:hypothetical protein AAEO56_14090 [Flavobacterium sp. DGU11]|uniref:Lipocalin-like domain-containing protein n=1 Tax=Flavobacterium arundinis TaxID=3139143 RepID=A0ABU9HZ19_9FLAO